MMINLSINVRDLWIDTGLEGIAVVVSFQYFMLKYFLNTQFVHQAMLEYLISDLGICYFPKHTIYI